MPSSTPVRDDYEPRLHAVTVTGPGLGDHATYGHASIATTASEIKADTSVVQFKIIATGAEARVLLDRLAAPGGAQ